tara:strand:+ start:4655 stop:6058 length:1404 start_codon:yes stop_codon:yes gene_type:complete
LNNLLLKSYLKCKRKAWLDLNGDKELQNWSLQKSIHLINEDNNFKLFSKGELSKGREACKKGYECVLGFRINMKLNHNLRIEVNPALLVKIEGESIWGGYKYIPAISKLGKKTTTEHILDLALCSIMLEKYQNTKIENGLVISNHQNIFRIEKININKRLKNKAINTFHELKDSLTKEIPKIAENRKKCAICSWQKFCDKEAKSRGFLTDIDGIGAKTASLLKNIGINNINQLAESDKHDLDDKLSLFQERNILRTEKFIEQSKSYITGIPTRVSQDNNLRNLFIKGNQGCYVFDIESNPDENHDFLYGFLSLENIFNNKFKYQPILNLNNDYKKMFLKEIFEEISINKNWPILHYGETEKISILNLAKEYNLKSVQLDDLISRFIDLHLLIRKTWILPVKNYSLKSIANWIGFNWEQENVSGSKALYWWIQYKSTKDDTFLKKIMKYNKDDCLATLNIAKWLLENK